jgi:peptide/nickel transport system ATP-binding protein
MTGDQLLRVRDLTIDFGPDQTVVSGVGFEVAAGETVALVGESGSGKSMTALSLVGLLPPDARRSGQATFAGEDLLAIGPERMRQIRGGEIAMIFQEPMTALNPVYRIQDLLAEAIRSHRSRLSRAEVRERALELLRLVGLPDPERRMRHYPHQLSGGQRQRAMIAMALAGRPRMLIADEPTTALDVTAQAEILDLLLDLQQRLGMAVIMITHNLGVVADVADRVVVLRDGEVVEQNECRELFAAPRTGYTQELLSAVPRLDVAPRDRTDETVDHEAGTVLEVERLVIDYPGRGRQRAFRAVDDVSLRVGDGEVIGLVGESGSGKSTIGRAALGLVPVTGGRVVAAGVDLAGARYRDLRRVRREVSMVFQDPASSLNPRATIGESVTAPLHWNGLERNAGRLRSAAGELLELVRIPAGWADRYPHELSGGQRQRVGIARALAVRPRLMIADEPTSALDVSVQATVLELLRSLQRDLGFSCLFISHDLAVVRQLCDRVVVLHRGQVAEAGRTGAVLDRPAEPYTRRLLASVTVPDPVIQRERRAARRRVA